MAILIGTDEAGYGPNLGPLVISATVWRVPDVAAAETLYELLGSAVTKSPNGCARKRNGRAGKDISPRVPIADSKVLYQSATGLANLERGLLAALGSLDRRPQCWAQAWQSLAAESFASCRDVPWYADFDAPLPLAADSEKVESLGPMFAAGLADAGVQLLDVRSRAVFAREFNELLLRHDGKGALLSHTTLKLAARLAEEHNAGEEPMLILCDKHGGRNRYAQLIEEHFPGPLVEIHGEGRQRSVYRFGPAERRVAIRFQTKAEAYLPVALASMASKYLRELAMHAFNDYWCRHVDGLQPTAGYPLDARRFRAAIADKQAELGIEGIALWREK